MTEHGLAAREQFDQQISCGSRNYFRHRFQSWIQKLCDLTLFLRRFAMLRLDAGKLVKVGAHDFEYVRMKDSEGFHQEQVGEVYLLLEHR